MNKPNPAIKRRILVKQTTFDPTITWQRLLATPDFAEIAPEGAVRELYHRLVIDELAGVVGNLLGARLTATTMLETRVRILRHIVDSGFLNEYFDALPDEEAGFLCKSLSLDLAKSTFASLLEMFERQTKNPLSLLEDWNNDEEGMLRHPRGGGLSAEAINVWRTGTLTVGGFLMMQPYAMFNFNKT